MNSDRGTPLLWDIGSLDPDAWRATAVPAARAASRAATGRSPVHDRLIMMVTRLGAVDADTSVTDTVLAGPLHGGAAADARRFLSRAERDGVDAKVEVLLGDARPVPGWGHRIYRDDDPRWRPIFEAIPDHPATRARLALVDEATAVAGSRLRVRPNVGWATGALAFVADLGPRSIELVMALSRMAGWIAHAIEEYEAPPVRFRGVARYVPVGSGERQRISNQCVSGTPGSTTCGARLNASGGPLCGSTQTA